MNELVSVIVPVYNTENKLKKCINSVTNSSYTNLEIIIVDDGSEEKTALLCNQLKQQDKRIKVIHQKNKGVSCARNKGIDIAKGEYITFVDADDYIDEKMIKVLLTNLRKYDADISMCKYNEIYRDKKICINKVSEIIKIQEAPDVLIDFFEKNEIGWNVWGKMYKREIVGTTRFLEGKRTAEDMYFLYQVLKKTKRLVIKENALYNYVKWDTSTMNSKNIDKFFDTFSLIQKVYEDSEVSEVYNESKLKFYLCKSLWFFKLIVAKGTKNNTEEIEMRRKKFLNNLQRKKIKCSFREKWELLLLNKTEFGFKIYSVIWGKYKRWL
ncbi:glycosyltransferase [uncultured Eubacterium sp.]|uniref:glycosyltransferase family 2 protein n=1 Tax=uncultured Eubacterium sp. TaxID=165185 RepID=UPI0032636874